MLYNAGPFAFSFVSKLVSGIQYYPEVLSSHPMFTGGTDFSVYNSKLP